MNKILKKYAAIVLSAGLVTGVLSVPATAKAGENAAESMEGTEGSSFESDEEYAHYGQDIENPNYSSDETQAITPGLDPENADPYTIRELSENNDADITEDQTEVLYAEEEEPLPYDPNIIRQDFSPDYRTYTIDLRDISLEEGEWIAVPVWSETGGQDDIKWNRALVKDDGTTEVEINIADYKSPGRFFVDFYKVSKDGEFSFICGTVFYVETAGSAIVTPVSLDKKSGTAVIKISDIDSPEGITGVMVPTWSRGDQSNLVWYAAKRNDDGSYELSFNVADHMYEWANYFSDVYVRDENGFLGYVGGTLSDFTVTAGQPEISLNTKESTCAITLKTDVIPDGFQKMMLPVWSEKDGQDDLKWIEMTADTRNNTFSTTFDTGFIKHTGRCFADVYARAANGKMNYVTGADFVIEQAAAEKIIPVTDNESGRFTVTISGISNLPEGAEVYVPVWCAKDQSDIIWYKAVKKGAKYVAEGSVANHGYAVGTYKAHVYAKSRGMEFMGETAMTFTAYVGELVFTDNYEGEVNKEQTEFTGTLKSLSYPGGLSAVKAAVWSEADGQDDLRWYNMTPKGGMYAFFLPISNHKTAGRYFADVYGIAKDGSYHYLTGSAGLSIDGSIRAKISIEEPEGDNAAFSVRITEAESLSGVGSVSVPVWTVRDGQDDIKWYKAYEQSDGSFVAVVSPANHKNEGGVYNIHVYATAGNGVFSFVGASSYECSLRQNMIMTADQNGKSTQVIYIYDPSDTPTSVAVWSDTGGQDDLRWYDMKKESSKIWKAEINVFDMKHSGKCYAHVYAGNKLLSGTAFKIDVSPGFLEKYLYGTDSNIDFIQCAINIAKDDSIGYGHTWPRTISCAGLVGLTLTYCGYGDFIQDDPIGWGYIYLSKRYQDTLKNEVGCIEMPFMGAASLKAGDILYRYTDDGDAHVAIYIGNGKTVEARGPSGATDDDASGDEVSVYPFAGSYNWVYRIPADKLHYR